MKKILITLSILIIVSCSKDDTSSSSQETNEFINSLVSRYKLNAIHTDIPVDLNNDGVSQTNLWEEADCFVFDTFGLYMAEFNYNERYDYKTFWIDLPSSHYVLETGSYETCLINHSMSYEYEVNEDTNEILVTYRDEQEATQGVLTHIKWENNILLVTYTKELYTSQGWQNINLTMEYIKI